MASLLVPFSPIVPKSFHLPSPLPSPTLSTAAPSPAPMAGSRGVDNIATARPLVPPGFMARVRAPPGFAPLHPNGPSISAQATFGPSLPGQAYQSASQAVFGQLQVLREGLETMHKELTWLKGQSKRQAGTLTWIMLGPDEYDKAKNAVANLEADVSQLINHTQGQDRKITNLKDRVETVLEDNSELKNEARGLKEELGRLRRFVKRIGVGASIVGGAVLIGGAVAWVKKN